MAATHKKSQEITVLKPLLGFVRLYLKYHSKYLFQKKTLFDVVQAFEIRVKNKPSRLTQTITSPSEIMF
ncbi:MAG: hypothetical protein ACFFFG_10375 [Candidatus Thorarchaeota archaeon]